MSDSTFPQIVEATNLLVRAGEVLAKITAKLASRPPPAPAATLGAPAALPEYLTTAQAAALLGVSTKGLEAMRARGAGPRFVRIGKRVRYRACDLPGAK